MATLREAALTVLSQANGPLSIEEITERAQELRLLSSTSKTPAASMGAAIYVDLKKNGESPFLQTGPRQFSLKPGVAVPIDSPRTSATKDFATQVDEHNTKIKEKLLATLKEIDPKAFEHLIGRLLERIGYEGVKVTKFSGDGGIDVTATLTVGGVTSVSTAVQVKRYDGSVSGKVVRELRGGIGVQERGLIITTGTFTKDAIVEAAALNKVPISLVDGRKLVELLVQKRLGVVSRTVEMLDLDLESLQVGEGEPVGVSGGLVRYQSVWPLPGGDYLAALNSMVEHVGSELPTSDEMIDWIKSTFPSVESSKVAQSYTNMVRYTGLVAYEGSKLTLTEAGAAYLTSPSKSFLLDLFSDRFVGFEELLDILRSKPGTLEDLHAALLKRIGATWTTTAQTRFRLEWLRVLGAAVRDDDGKWCLAP